MRWIPFTAAAVLTTGLVWALNKSWGPAPPFGKFLSPQTGFWQNAEPEDADYSGQLHPDGMKGKGSVYLDERLVPHIFAENDEDLYFMQGYVHARFRLFQMDLQTKAAAGRASELAGARAIEFDRGQRRLGMVYAAENAVREIEKDPVQLACYNAYTRGVNAYIHSLRESQLPLEYKLLDVQPEEWSNLRTALLMKMMAKNLSSGTENDLAYTNAKLVFTPEEFGQLYPQVNDSLAPIIPRGTVFDTATVNPVPPASADSLYFGRKDSLNIHEPERPDPGNGSNNWVIAGSRTQSGSPILCNDPHLELTLPSIWFEIQLTTPASNVYGVSLPGTPFVIIGFNDSIAWGVTNAGRDVKDYYEIRFRDHSRTQYWFNGQWQPTQIRVEEIKVKGGAAVYDTVAYTAFGPVMYDASFAAPAGPVRNLAVRWMAHDPSDVGRTFYRLNRAHNYDEYAEALTYFTCPGQNFAFASKTGDIAIWQQGLFPARWQGQGLYVMPGEDNSYAWQGFIPQTENPHAKNPERGFLESANQRAVDSAYPYFIPGAYIAPRGISIEKHLAGMTGVTVDDMKRLQNDYFNVVADMALALMLKYVRPGDLTSEGRKYLDMLRNWDRMATPDSKGQTVFQCWWDSLKMEVWGDDIRLATPELPLPNDETIAELLIRDSTSLRFADNLNTPKTESLEEDLTVALNKAAVTLVKSQNENKLEWSRFKEPGVYHLLKDLLPFARTNLHLGGNGNIINAVTKSHGPSWRMIVQLGEETEAWGVYPAGQNGNPGSRFYDAFVDTWAKGEYFRLWVMKQKESSDKRVKWTMNFDPAR